MLKTLKSIFSSLKQVFKKKCSKKKFMFCNPAFFLASISDLFTIKYKKKVHVIKTHLFLFFKYLVEHIIIHATGYLEIEIAQLFST